MSVFILKLIAVCSMLIDHTAYFLFFKYHIQNTVYIALRCVGRLAFPIFAFLIVNGWKHTSDRAKYLSRLTMFALISQIPFSLTASVENYSHTAQSGISFCYPLAAVLAVTVFVCLVWFFTVRRDRSALLPAALLPVAIRLGVGGVYILNFDMNVFYTLALGLACICFIDSAIKKDRPVYVRVLWFLAVCAAICIIRDSSDYGYGGIALIIGLYLAGSKRPCQALILALWCIYNYSFQSGPHYLLSAAFSIALIVLYNNDLGKKYRTVFYVLYPVHLFLLGLLTSFK